MAQVTLRKIVKKYDEVLAVRGIDLDIADKEFIVLVGPSGCGKSTTLRMIAGLEEITGGDIAIGGDVVNDVPPKDRDIAMVFQNYALYPHMNVYENMSFGLKLKRTPKDEIDRRVKQAAQILDITELLDRKPKQLSGGQRQRVAMGRAIVRDPKVFLFDEPLSQPRRQAARADAHRDQEGAPEGPHHHGLRHPRPGRGDDAGRPRGGDECRPDRAGRHAQRPLPFADHQVRGRLHRLAGDELHPLPARAGGRRAARAAERQALPSRCRPTARRATAAMSARRTWCSACGPSTSPRPGRTSSPTSTTST